MTTQLTLAFSAGMLAVINPCGFAMLPAYLSYFLGLDDPSAHGHASVLRAVKVSLAVSAGFMAVFGAIGVVLELFSVQYEQYLPWVTMVMGVGLVVLGVAMLAGFQPMVSLPHLERGGQTRELPSMALFGVSYAVASLSCTLPVFLFTVANAFSADGFAQGMAIYLAFAGGMAVLLAAITVSLALARRGLVNDLRRFLPHVSRVAGGLLVLAGIYLTYWGWYERQVLDGDLDPGGPAELVQDWNDSIRRWIDETGPTRIGVVLGLFLVAVVGTLWWRARGRRSSGDRASNDPSTPAATTDPDRSTPAATTDLDRSQPTVSAGADPVDHPRRGASGAGR